MKKIMPLLIAFFIISTTGLAQQTTVSNIEQLRQILPYMQAEDGQLEFYSLIRNEEVSLGRLSGNIIVQLPDRITARNAEYTLITDSGQLILIKGELTITKPQEGKIYPKITLLNGIAESNGHNFICGEKCETISIDPNTMEFSITGEAIITDTREEAVLQDNAVGDDKALASNIIVKPLETAEEEDRQEIAHLEFRTTESQEISVRLGRMMLTPNSNGEYILESIIRPITRRLSYREIISGNVGFEFANPLEEERIIHSENEAMYVSQAELLKLRYGIIDYADTESFAYNCLFTSGLSCLHLNKIERKVTVTVRSETILDFNANNPAINSIEILPFQPGDSISKLILYNPNLGNRKIVFSRDNVIADGNWHDFGISFKSQIYSEQERRYDTLECKYLENKCYLNGIEITLRPQFQELARCGQNSDCGAGKICESERCIEQNECRTIIEGQTNDPLNTENIDILFVGDGFTEQRELERAVARLINNRDGLFSKEPFRRNQNKFNIMIKTLPSATIDRFGRPDISSIDLSNCPQADVTVILSTRPFSSNANIPSRVCKISMQIEGSEDQRRFIHEFGHCFGSLNDEYYFPGARLEQMEQTNCIAPSRTTSAKEIAKERWADILRQESGMTRERSEAEAESLANQAAQNWKGCGGYCRDPCREYIRASENSIMNTYFLPSEEADNFNRISKLYLQDKINRNTILG